MGATGVAGIESCIVAALAVAVAFVVPRPGQEGEENPCAAVEVEVLFVVIVTKVVVTGTVVKEVPNANRCGWVCVC